MQTYFDFNCTSLEPGDRFPYGIKGNGTGTYPFLVFITEPYDWNVHAAHFSGIRADAPGLFFIGTCKRDVAQEHRAVSVLFVGEFVDKLADVELPRTIATHLSRAGANCTGILEVQKAEKRREIALAIVQRQEPPCNLLFQDAGTLYKFGKHSESSIPCEMLLSAKGA